MNRVAAITILLIGGFGVRTAHGDPAALLAEAIETYREGMDSGEQDVRLARFRRAYQLFHQAAQESGAVSADLYVNMGNAAFLCARRGEAILAYRRALVIEPGNARARLNLEHARAQLPAWVPRPPSRTLLDTFLGWGHLLSPGSRLRLAAICFALAALLFAWSIRYRRPGTRTIAFLPLAAWAMLIGSAAWSHYASAQGGDAVITADEAIARSADSAHAPSRFAEALPSGTEVQLLENRDAFSYIRLADGRDAWIRSSALAPVAPSD